MPVKEKTMRERATENLKDRLDWIKPLIKQVLDIKNERKSEEALDEIQQFPLEVATGKEFNGTRTYMILFNLNSKTGLSRGRMQTRVMKKKRYSLLLHNNFILGNFEMQFYPYLKE